MKVGIVYDPKMGNHQDPLDSHPECPDRIYRIYQELGNRKLLSKMIAVPSRLASDKELLLCHSQEYLEKLSKLFSNLDTVSYRVLEEYDDIYANADSLECARLAAGSTLNLVDALLHQRVERGVAVVRPPGHHAGRNTAMGFCYFNNVAIAAIKARNAGKRVAIVDFDVHHGNGTQDLIENEPEIFFFSIHRHDGGEFYPGTGDVSPASNIYNYPINKKRGNDWYYTVVFEDMIVPKLRELSPDIILVSAGFDAAAGDPLGGFSLTPNCYRRIVELLLTAQSRVALVLEGGYNLKSTEKSMAACVETLLDEEQLKSQKS